MESPTNFRSDVHTKYGIRVAQRALGSQSKAVVAEKDVEGP